MKKVLILGHNGFIGTHLTKRLLQKGYEITGIDISLPPQQYPNIGNLIDIREDIYGNLNNISCMIKEEEYYCIVNLASICNPALYNTHGVETIESNYNNPARLLEIIQKYDRRLIHFSTCEVYGKTVFQSPDSDCLLGPVNTDRWTYATAKLLMDRYIYAYGKQFELKYSIIRPYNFIGPYMDFYVEAETQYIPRVFATFLSDLINKRPLKVVDGGTAGRVFTYIKDAIDAIELIIDNPEQANGKIYNVGNPENHTSILNLAEGMQLYYAMITHTKLYKVMEQSPIEKVRGIDLYGTGYEDSPDRMPDVREIFALKWNPIYGLQSTIRIAMHEWLDVHNNHIGIDKTYK